VKPSAAWHFFYIKTSFSVEMSFVLRSILSAIGAIPALVGLLVVWWISIFSLSTYFFGSKVCLL
jgi:hypothetical protein